jgi:putative endonuclease
MVGQSTLKKYSSPAPGRKASKHTPGASSGQAIKMEGYFVYILAGRKKGELYVGMAKNLKRRVSEHKNDLRKGFTEKYKVKKLVYYEQCDGKKLAVLREKQLKKWNKSWKIRLIEKFNPGWKDLYSDLNSAIAVKPNSVQTSAS